MGYDDFDGFDGFDENAGGQGIKQLRAAYKALEKKHSDLEAAHATLTSQHAQRNLKDVLAEKGLRPGLARIIAKEDVDLTDSKAVDAWLSDPANQEDFQFSIASGTPATDAGSDEGADGGHEDYAANLAKIQGASNGAMPNDRFAQAEAAIKAASTPAELQAALDAALKNAS